MPGGTEALVDQMAAADARRSAAVHAAELADGFFSELGEGFLRWYHDAHRRSPYGIALVARSGDEVVGFVVGAVDERRHLAWVVRHRGARLALVGILALASRPTLAAHFIRTRSVRYLRGGLRLLRGRIRGGTTESAGPTVVAGVLSHVAVDAPAQGRGVGSELVRAFVSEALDRGAGRVRTMTRAGDGGATSLYLSLGWRQTASRPDLDGTPFDHLDITA